MRNSNSKVLNLTHLLKLFHTLNIILSGFEMKEVPLNSLPATTYGFTMPSFYLYLAFSIYSYSSLLNLGIYY